MKMVKDISRVTEELIEDRCLEIVYVLLKTDLNYIKLDKKATDLSQEIVDKYGWKVSKAVESYFEIEDAKRRILEKEIFFQAIKDGLYFQRKIKGDE